MQSYKIKKTKKKASKSKTQNIQIGYITWKETCTCIFMQSYKWKNKNKKQDKRNIKKQKIK